VEMASKRRGSQASNLVEVAHTKMKVRTYSTLGLRPDADFMLWMISHSIEKMQILTSKVYSTIIGKYIEPSHVYLSCIRESVYSTNKIMPGFMTDEKLKSGRK
jgi:chlorite dismutase